MTTAFCDVIREVSHPTYPELMRRLQGSLYHRGFSQRPQLTSAQRFDLNHRVFSLTDVVDNSNAQTGRIFRKRFPPRKNKMIGGGLGEMLGGSGDAMILGSLAGMALGALFFD